MSIQVVVCCCVGMSLFSSVTFRICSHLLKKNICIDTYVHMLEISSLTLWHFLTLLQSKCYFLRKHMINISLPEQSCLHCNRQINELSKDQKSNCGISITSPLDWEVHGRLVGVHLVVALMPSTLLLILIGPRCEKVEVSLPYDICLSRVGSTHIIKIITKFLRSLTQKHQKRTSLPSY